MTMRLLRSNLDSRLWISWGICFNTSSPWGCTGPPVVKARYNIIFKSLSTKSPSRRLTPIITMHTIPRNMDTEWCDRTCWCNWEINDLNWAISIFVLVVTMKNLPVSYCTGSLSNMIFTSDWQASKWRRTSMTAVLWVFTTGKSRLIEASALCQVVTSWFISVIFSGEGMPMRSFADERMLNLMWLSLASTVFVCWLHSALLDDDLVGCWLEAGLWLIGDYVCSEILEHGVSSKSQWNSSSTPVIVASGDNAIRWTPVTIALKELSYDDAELGGAWLLWVELCIEGLSSSVVTKSRAPAASASQAWACWTVHADRTSWSWHSRWTRVYGSAADILNEMESPKVVHLSCFHLSTDSALGSSTCTWWRLRRWVAGDECGAMGDDGQVTETPGVSDPLSGLIWL